eukprot:g9894.t1
MKLLGLSKLPPDASRSEHLSLLRQHRSVRKERAKSNSPMPLARGDSASRRGSFGGARGASSRSIASLTDDGGETPMPQYTDEDTGRGSDWEEDDDDDEDEEGLMPHQHQRNPNSEWLDMRESSLKLAPADVDERFLQMITDLMSQFPEAPNPESITDLSSPATAAFGRRGIHISRPSSHRRSGAAGDETGDVVLARQNPMYLHQQQKLAAAADGRRGRGRRWTRRKKRNQTHPCEPGPGFWRLRRKIHFTLAVVTPIGDGGGGGGGGDRNRDRERGEGAQGRSKRTHFPNTCLSTSSFFPPSTQRTMAAVITASALGGVAYAWVSKGGSLRSPSSLLSRTFGKSTVSCSAGTSTSANGAAAAPTAPAGGADSLKPLVVCGPSGVGKGTLINMLREDFPGRFGFSVSHTTRKPRPGEVHGTHYYFSEKPEMQAEIDDSKFIEHANVHGNLYGTSIAAVQSVTAAGKICILDIDVQGVKSVRNAGRSVLDPHYLFISAPSMEVLEARLRGRGTETEEALQRRLANAKAEMEYGLEADNFEKVLVNDGLEEAYAELKETAKAWYPQLAQDEEKKARTPTEA